MNRLANKTFVTAAMMLVTSPAAAASKPLITYFQPMPIVGKLSNTVWGAGAVGARDPANGIEDNGATGGVGAQQETNFYWDGKIVHGNDGKYHLYVVHWAHSEGFGPPAGGSTGWHVSIPMQATSDNPVGPYTSQGDCYTMNAEGTNKGHNLTSLVAPTGSSPYTLSVGEIVPGQMFNSSSPNGPWALMGLTKTDLNGHSSACGDLSSNFTFALGPDNRFWATSRSGCVMDSDQVLGTYKVETNSILPNLENNDNGNAEDEVIWYSGGYFHIVYNYWNVQRAYHIMSKNGTTNWTSTGLAYEGTQSPKNQYSSWLRYTDGTVNQWHNMERPGVLIENGHVTHFTFAVTDTNKNVSGVSQGGSKIIVVPFNGVQFDCDNGDTASCNQPSPDGGVTNPIDGGILKDSGASGSASGSADSSLPTGPASGSGGSSSGSDTSGSTAPGDSGANASGADEAGTSTGADTTGPSGGASGSGIAGTTSGSGGDTSGATASSGQAATTGGSATGSATASGSGNGSTSEGSGQNGGCGVTAAHPDSTQGLVWFGGALVVGAGIHRRRRAHEKRGAASSPRH